MSYHTMLSAAGLHYDKGNGGLSQASRRPNKEAWSRPWDYDPKPSVLSKIREGGSPGVSAKIVCSGTISRFRIVMEGYRPGFQA